MEIEKNISFFVDQQFPAIYRENGPELVELARYYYKFLEDTTNQTLHVNRRLFEYKDVDTTVKELLIFFHKKFLADLPLKENIVPFLTKNILDLYRRKGTPAGIEVFFSIFFNEYDIEIFYPAEKMLKVSNSKWRQGVYLQLFPNNNYFLSKSDKAYTYADLISQNITGSVSGAKGAVSRINFILIDGTKTPIIYIDEVQGNFTQFDDITTVINGELVNFGVVNGSLSDFIVDTSPEAVRTTYNNVGDIYNVRSENGFGGKVVVTEVSDQISGQIDYELIDGGYGYTVENTRLLVSNQTILLNNENLDFVIYETLRDTAGNEGIVIGQTNNAVGVRMNSGNEFNISRNIFAVDRAPGIALQVEFVSEINNSSPGTLFPDDGLDTSVIADITNTADIEVIFDVIQPFAGVNLNAADYEAAAPMSGSASPVTINTPLDEAFDISTLTIGKISLFRNVGPGSNYKTQVFARAQDNVVNKLQRRSQILRLDVPGNAGIFNKGEIITEDNTGTQAEVLSTDTVKGLVTINAFSYEGFNGQDDVIRSNGDAFVVNGVELDSSSNVWGDNAVVDAETEFATGQISKVRIINSGFGYLANTVGELIDEDGDVQAEGTIIQNTQGFTEGYWADFTSHLNGHIQKQIDPETTPILPTRAFATQVSTVAVGATTNPTEFAAWGETIASDGFAYLDMNEDGNVTSSDSLIFLKIAVGSTDVTEDQLNRWNNIVVPSLKAQFWYLDNSSLYEYLPTFDYFNSSMRIQDSDFYQDYSYQIKSTLPLSLYEDSLKENVHLAGTKLFGDFVYKVEVPGSIRPRFLRLFNDQGKGSPLDIANTDLLEASVTNFTADSTFVTADHEPI